MSNDVTTVMKVIRNGSNCCPVNGIVGVLFR